MKTISSTYRREQERLLKEKIHYLNALEAIHATGDQKGIAELNQKIDDVDSALEASRAGRRIFERSGAMSWVD